MPESHLTLPSELLDLCAHCSKRERQAVVAYCCHLSFADRSVRRMETDFVRTIADHLGVKPELTARMARLARRRRLRIKAPKSEAGRQLMFHLALRMAVADDEIDARERTAITNLARQLGIPEGTVTSEIEKLETIAQQPSTTSEPSTTSARPDITASPRDADSSRSKGFFASLFDSLTTDWVAEDLEAVLFRDSDEASENGLGEVEYTLTRNGEVTLEVALNPLGLPSGETVLVVVSDQPICEISLVGERIGHTIRAHDHEIIPKISRGDTVEIQHRGKTILTGVFHRD